MPILKLYERPKKGVSLSIDLSHDKVTEYESTSLFKFVGDIGFEFEVFISFLYILLNLFLLLLPHIIKSKSPSLS